MAITRRRIISFVALALTLTLPACEEKEDKKPTEQKATAEPKEDEQKEEEKPEATGPSPKEPHSSSIAGTENQLLHDDDIPGASMTVAAPKDGATLYSGKKVEVKLDVKNYRTGEEIGQHVHVILDNNPYIAHYNADEPLVLEDVKPGTHTIRAFPARHYHLSLKKGDVFDTVTFHVKEKSKDFGFDPSKPYVTYSRPKGTYSQEAAKDLLLDFYVQNVELGEDAKVVYGVDGEENELTEWKPVLLEPLEPGEHEITLKLVDGDGKVIKNGGYNNTTRTITVE